jgi:hypothetical protein
MWALPATTIRGGWLAVTISTGYLLSIKYGLMQIIKNLFRKTLLKIILIAAICIITTYVSNFLYNIKPDSSFGRLLIWKVSFSMIQENPLFGLGYDTFGAKYNDYQAKCFAKNERNDYEKLVAGNNRWVFNEFIETTIELGIIGLLIFVLIFSLVIFKRNSEENTFNKDKEYLPIIIPSSIIAILIFSLTGYPFTILPTLINTVFLIAFFSGNIRPLKEVVILNNDLYSAGKLSFPFMKSVYVLLLLAVCILFTYKLSTYYKAYLLLKEAELNSSFQHYDLAIKQYRILYPIMKNNGNFLMNYGGTLSVAGYHNEALRILEGCRKINSELNLYIALGMSYEALGETKLAENSYVKASFMIPNLFYPEYLLEKLYEKTGKFGMAGKLATEIIKAKPKISSTAINEMKEEMKESLQRMSK